MAKNKVILDLCGGTGSWSAPYRKAGYKVILVTLPECDVTKTVFDYRGCIRFRNGEGVVQYVVPVDSVYGILAAPPCTMFSFARTNARTPRDIGLGMECVRACLDIIWRCQSVTQSTNKKTLPLAWWALENPYHGMLKQIIGRPCFTFDPYEFGDGYKKRTALWGSFKDPIKLKKFETPRSNWASKKFDRLKSNEIHAEYFGKYDRTTRRSITPRGFAEAFFMANQ